MATIGQTLSAARIAAGFTVADLSARTRVRESVLRGIEEEDFVPCGGDFYARGHIRGICKALGLDPKPLITEFDGDHASSAIPAFVPPPRHPASSPAVARAAAAADRGEAYAAADQEPMAGPALRFGDDGDDGSRSERWGHFERGQNLRRGVRGGRPRPGRAAAVPEQRRSEERRGRRGVPRDSDDRAARSEGARRPQGSRRADGRRGAGARPAPRPPVTAARARRRGAVRRHWPWAVVGIIVLLGVVVGVRTWQDWDGDHPLRTAFESNDGGETVDSAVLPGEGADAAAGAQKAAEAAPVEFTVALESAERSWIKVTDADGGDLFTGFLLEDEAQEYEAEGSVMVWVGDAGSINVTVDGEDLGPAGESGEVKEFTVGPDGFDQ